MKKVRLVDAIVAGLFLPVIELLEIDEKSEVGRRSFLRVLILILKNA
jgi:hypothetical protein